MSAQRGLTQALVLGSFDQCLVLHQG
jgi:hypothetical protein